MKRVLRSVFVVLPVWVAPALAEESDMIEHVVVHGETLSSIAALRTVYADPYLWPVIYRFNRDQIQDPKRIYPGQRLQIPILVDEEERRLARVEAGASPEAP